jgi:hypothetical protein
MSTFFAVSMFITFNVKFEAFLGESSNEEDSLLDNP